MIITIIYFLSVYIYDSNLYIKHDVSNIFYYPILYIFLIFDVIFVSEKITLISRYKK